MVRKVRVLGQQRAVQVGAEDVARGHAFGAILPVVAGAGHDAAQRRQLRAEKRASAVVLEADQGARLQAQPADVHDHVADAAPGTGLGVQVEQPEAGEPLALGRLVVVPEQLVSAADRQQGGAARQRARQGLRLELQEVVVDQRLLPVLAAAEEEDVHVL